MPLSLCIFVQRTGGKEQIFLNTAHCYRLGLGKWAPDNVVMPPVIMSVLHIFFIQVWGVCKAVFQRDERNVGGDGIAPVREFISPLNPFHG